MFHRQKIDADQAEPQAAETTDATPEQKKEGSSMSAQTDSKNDNQNRTTTPQNTIPRMPGSYPGFSSSGSNFSANTPVQSGQDRSGRKLIVGKGISMSGEIEACDILIVEGKVEAALKGAKILEITESGTFFGTVEIDEATVAGSFEGDLTVKGRLNILSSGSITGAVSYGELSVQAGATIEGSLSPLAKKSAATAPTAPKKQETQRVQNHQQQTQKVAQDTASQNNDGELFEEPQRAAAAE